MSRSQTRKPQVNRHKYSDQPQCEPDQSFTGKLQGQDALHQALHVLGNEQVQRLVTSEQAIDGDGKVAAEVEASIHSAQAGHVLDATTRESMEAAFGADFGAVRVHTNEHADQLNRALQARAFTTGERIFFSRGAYDPTSAAGSELLAHELTHVVQQGGGRAGRKVQAQLTVSEPGDQQEQEAERTARAVLSGNLAPIAIRAPSGKEIKRRPEKKEDQATETMPSSAVQTWEATPEQEQFREQTLIAHIDQSSKVPGAQQPDLTKEDLARVNSTSISLQKEAAVAASNLLAAANSALAKAQESGNPDALRTKRITASSGYRSSKRQRTLWVSYFPEYYSQTAKTRAKLEGGPHGDAAIKYMMRFITSKVAAPGFSNHQAGLAIDFLQARIPGAGIENKTEAQTIQAWRTTWFFAWLRANAATYRFVEYNKEPWHWVYKPESAESFQTESQHHD